MKQFFKVFFKSLWKNDACIEGGRHYKWWVGVIFFLLSSIISIIPITVQAFTIDAGTFITNASMDIDKGWNETLKLMNEEGKKVDIVFHNETTDPETFEKFAQEGKSVKPYITLEGEKNWPVDKDDKNNVISKLPYIVLQSTLEPNEKPTDKPTEETTKPSETEQPTEAVAETPTEQPSEKPSEEVTTNPNVKDPEVHEGELKAYFKLYAFPELKGEEFNNKIYAVLANKNPYTTDGNKDMDLTANKTSFAIFGQEAFAIYKYNAKGSQVGALSGTYRYITTSRLSNLLKESFNETITETATFLNEGYYELKLSNGGVQVSIYAAINSGMILVMGLVIFLMTRGKQNPYRIYKFGECINISTWVAFTPSILTLIFGFIFAGNSMGAFMFILTFGIRSMWLSMKNLRPNA